MSEGVVAAAEPALSQGRTGQPHLVAGLLSLPKACSPWRVPGEEFRSACHAVASREWSN
jgi:hypothetical protein